MVHQPGESAHAAIRQRLMQELEQSLQPRVLPILDRGATAWLRSQRQRWEAGAHVEGLVLLDADAHPVQHHDGGEPPRLLELPLPQL